MKRYGFIVAAALMALAACQQEADLSGVAVTFSASVPETRTALGDKDGSVWANNWSEGDMISVNGVASAALDAAFVGKRSAEFTVSGVAAPYCAAYPASAVSNYANGSATVVIPAEQQYVAGSYDPAAYLMTAKSSSETLSFAPQVALFKLIPTGAGVPKIRSVSLTSLGGRKIAGAFTTSFAALTSAEGAVSTVKVTSQEGVAVGEPWLIAFAASDFTAEGIQVLIEDVEGGQMTCAATPSKPYAAGKMYTAEIPYIPGPSVANIFGKVTCDGVGVPGVLVSDGIDIVETDADGNYRMSSDKKWKYVFMTVPSGYEAPLDGILPRIWTALKADAATPEQVDFELQKVSNDNYTLLVLGDLHLARRTGDLAQFEKVAGFMNKTIAAAPGKVYALTLGDMTWDMYWISNNYGFSDYLQTMNGYFTGVPFFHTMGNHDNEMEVGGDYLKCLKYTENLSPDYYSFNLGKIHYIVLDNMDFTGVEPGQDNRSKYAKNYTAEQLEWLRKDLSYVDKATPVFVTSHEPLARPSGLSWGEQLNGKDADLDTFIGIFDGYNVRFLSGHTHNLFNRDWTSSFTEHNSGAVCASWWWSGYITPGIHIAQDGAPGGYTIWTVNGTDCTHYYQAALQSPDYQFRAYDMNKVKETITADLSSHSGYPKYYNHIQSYGDNIILVNVWDYDDDWKVEISENGSPLEVSEAGVYDPLHIYAMTIPRLNDYNTTTFSTAKWRHFFQATASAPDTPVTVKVTDRYGRVFTEEMVRPKAFRIDEYKNEVQLTKPEAEFVSASSSSLVFGWTCGGTAAEDADVPYHLALYRDAACTDLALSFDVPSGSSCWSGKPLRFTFGSLAPSTTYYFVATNAQNGDASDPVSGTTEAFDIVTSASLTNAGAGDVILAEDFSEIGWGADMLANAAGFIPSGKPLAPVSGNYTTDDGTFQPFDNTAGRVYGEARVPSDKRLFNWGFFGNSSVYAYSGYLRVGSSSSGARTHIVSPALSCIPEGKVAVIDVTVTSSKYDNSENDVAVFLEDHSALTLALAPDQKENGNFSGKGGKYTGASLSDGYPLDTKVKQWSTKTIRIEGVTCNNCLLFGSYQNIDKKNRFFLSDVVVKIVSIGDKPEPAPIEVECTNTSSSTLIFTWTEGNGAAADVANAYTATLYKDRACTIEDQSFDFPADLGAWKGKQPKYIFGGLTPSTDYWLKVKDTTNGLESNAVKATTDAFTVVEMPESITGTGVVLAEDFGEIRWEFDHITTAVGFRPSDNSSFANTGVKTSENSSGNNIYSGYHYSGGGEMLFKSPATALNNSRLKNWLSDTNVYLHPGYLKLGTSSTRGWILTPEFTVPAGRKAIVKVTITAARLNTSQDSDWGVVVLSPALAKADPGAHTAAFDWPDETDQTLYQTISFSNTNWATKSVSGLELRSGDRIAFGGKNHGDSKKGRAHISDMVVEVISIEDDDASRITKVSVIGDSISTFAGWCDTTRGGAYYPKSDGDVTTVDKTWWYKLIYSYMSTGKFEKNISAGNTTVVQNTTGDSSAYWYGWDFGTRLQQLGIGNPDVVLIHGGTNDYGHTSWYGTSEELISGVAMNAGSFPSSAQGALDALFAAADAATAVDAADALDGSTFCSAYIRLIRMIQTRHPSAKVVCVIGDYLRGGQADAIKLIASHFGEDKVRVADLIGGGVSIPKYSNPHPNAAGMAAMADFIYGEVGSWIDVK